MIKVIKEVSKEDLEKWIYNINEDDKNLYIELNNPDKIGIFQINGSTAERLCGEVEPANFNELVAINAMARPGPMEVSAPFFVQRKKGEASPYPPAMNEILKDTYSTFLYQEQIMETFHKIGGFTLTEADEVRGLMKKLGKAEKKEDDVKKWNKVIKKFITNASKLGIDEKMSIKISEDLQAFASYSFNRSHATSYGYIALITLYLSFYFRKYFYSSVLAYEVDREKYLLQRLNSVRRQGIEILPIDINKSNIHFSPDSNNIRFGLSDVKFVSEGMGEQIVKNAPYNSVFEFMRKNAGRALTIRVLESLISVGAFDSIYSGRKKLLHIVKTYWEKKKAIKVEEKLKGIYDEAIKTTEMIPALEDTENDLMEYEKEFIGFKFFSSSFTKDRIAAIAEMKKRRLIYYSFDDVGDNSMKCPLMINSLRLHIDKNGNQMAFLSVEDVNGRTESIPLFASFWKYLNDVVKTDSLFLMNVYRNTMDKIMFGQSKFTQDELLIRRMMKKI